MRRILVISALALSGLSLAGCSATSSGSSTSSASDTMAEAPMPMQDGAELGTTVDIATGAGAGAAAGSAADRQVITTGTATITAVDPVAAAAKAVTIVEAAGGRVDARQQQAPVDGDKGSASLTLRIPSADLTATLDRIKRLGEVENVQLAANDVTFQTQDLGARITALRTSVDRLLELLENATSTKDLITLETAISDRQANLESMEAQLRSLTDQVEMSTISVSFISEADAPVTTPDTFLSGLTTGWESFVTFVAGVLVVTGVAIPWLVFFGLFAIVGLVVVQRRRRRARAVASD